MNPARRNRLKRLRESQKSSESLPDVSSFEHLKKTPSTSTNGELSLHEIGIKHKTDKVGHNYLGFYEKHLAKFRYKKIRVLEIGIGAPAHAKGIAKSNTNFTEYGGSSLRMWEEYFPNAEIYGMDISKECLSYKYKSNRVKTIIGDQTDREFLTSIPGEFDVIIDDGGHTVSQQMITLGCMFKKLKEHGVYILEDLHTSLMEGYYGGNKQNIDTALSALQDLGATQKINNNYLLKAEKDYIQGCIGSVQIHGFHGVGHNNNGSITSVLRKNFIEQAPMKSSFVNSPRRINLDNTAIFLHMFYFDLWEEISGKLKKAPFKHNLYVNIVDQKEAKEMKSRVLSDFPNAKVIISKNSGLDVGGQLRLLDLWLKDGSKEEYLIFLHGKKSLHDYYEKDTGEIWRKELFQIISPDKKSKIIKELTDKNTGIIGFDKWVLTYNSNRESTYECSKNSLDRYLDKFNLDIELDEMIFIGGTMFLVRSSIFKDFFTKNPPLMIAAELEENFVEREFDTKTHAMERIFGFLAIAYGYKVKGI